MNSINLSVSEEKDLVNGLSFSQRIMNHKDIKINCSTKMIFYSNKQFNQNIFYDLFAANIPITNAKGYETPFSKVFQNNKLLFKERFQNQEENFKIKILNWILKMSNKDLRFKSDVNRILELILQRIYSLQLDLYIQIMNSSQRRDGVFSFNMLNPQLSYKVDSKWRKDVLKDVNIYVSDKKDNVNLDLPESLPKLEKEREWSDYGIQELLGKFIDGNKKQ